MIYRCSNCGKCYTRDYKACPNCGGVMFIDEAPINSDKNSVGLNILSFFIFWVGIILYFVYRKSSPKKAKGCLISALIVPVIAVISSLFNYTDNLTSIADNRTIHNYYAAESKDINTQEPEKVIVYEKCSISEMYDEDFSKLIFS